ncbi:hypothetical protein [Segatella copri]|uniref:Uncharacterized protein n=1 Tax=Segatella copri TaxID=165179 RepID=A0A6G1VKK6_9BACT|nr:hypothetical protein [Segatella copri]MQN58789.1 hypothetical protein [Segatella copri]MQP13930.1 hypothetical protein [Segatella copri]
MIIEQTLYGYNKGHGLLASSFPVRPNNDSSLMSVLSDWTGFRNELGEDSYMTFYPLSNGEKYAFAKTWYADEMERPGCVWTHTLIVDLNDMDRNFDFRVLNDYFRRPQKDEYDFYQHKIEIDNFETRYSNVVFSMFDDTSLLVLYLLLLGNNKNLFIYMDKDQRAYVALCFYLLQYLPLDILKWVSLSTGSVSRRKLGSEDFSIQFTDNITNISLSNAPWNGKIAKENFTNGLLYIFEQSKRENDTFPSLIRLFREDIKDEQEKLFAFAMLMKELDTALNEKVGGKEYANVLSLLEEYFPEQNEGIRLKSNFLSEKISSLYGTEEDYLFHIASLKNDSFLHPLLTHFTQRLMLLDKNRHNDYVALIDKIAKIEHPNATACNGLIYAIDHMEEEELLRMASNNWKKILPFLNDNDRFFDSGMWLRISNEQFNDIFLLYCRRDFATFKYWDELLKKVIASEALADENISSQLVINTNDAVQIIFDSANNPHLSVISPFLLLSCMQKKEEFWGWLEKQKIINERVENFIIHQIDPTAIYVKKSQSCSWRALLEADNGEKCIDFYLYLYLLAHNWKDRLSVEMLKHSFYPIYQDLSKSKLSIKDWDRISRVTPNRYFIANWDKCKILSRGLVDYLKDCDVDIDEVRVFSPNKKVNERLTQYWKKKKN